MKLAFVHCRIMPGGALNVLKDLIIEEKSKHPHNEIRIFTLVSDSKALFIEAPLTKGGRGDLLEVNITTALPSRLNHLFTTRLDYRNLILFAPRLMKVLSRKINKFHPHEIHISSFAIAKNIDIPRPDKGGVRGGFVSLYLHSPMQYIRSHYEEYTHKLKGRKGRLFKKIAPRLRKRDKKFIEFDEVYANSNYTAHLAKEIYGLDAKVKYPIVHMTDVESFRQNDSTSETLPYYIYTGRLVRFVKEVDKIIQLFNHTNDPLIIIGSGPDEIYLKSIAHKNIIFVDRTDDKNEMYKILAQASGFINLTKESFGISTAEALLLGIPVFGYNQGATPELVDENSGILVDKKDLHTLINKFTEFKKRCNDLGHDIEVIPPTLDTSISNEIQKLKISKAERCKNRQRDREKIILNIKDKLIKKQN